MSTLSYILLSVAVVFIVIASAFARGWHPLGSFREPHTWVLEFESGERRECRRLWPLLRSGRPRFVPWAVKRWWRRKVGYPSDYWLYLSEWWHDRKHPDLDDGRDEENVYTTGTGQVICGVHDPSQCAGRPCVIHNPSNHSMRDWPTNFRSGGFGDIKPPHMERMCPHGIGHPDPDDLAYWESRGESGLGVHGCDGCCG